MRDSFGALAHHDLKSGLMPILRCLTLTGVCLALAACGGGGGGGSGISVPPSIPTTPAPTPNPQPPISNVSKPSQTSREYTRNWGLADTKAFAAWDEGATGKGVTVAVVDTGIDRTHRDLSVNISPASTDIISGRNTPEGDSRHGTFAASIIAAPYNDYGTVGIAYNSTILSIRADIADCEDEDDDVCFRSTDLARSMDYAVANGASIINLSLGGEDRMGSAFEQAMLRAINAGVIFAISSGNESEDNPGWPGRYASDPRFAGSIITVGAHEASGAMASFSNKAGVTQASYLSAPGGRVVADCTDDGCWARSGTSFSAPAVAAAMALLQEAFPNLTGKEVVDILLRTAKDAGETGTDTVWGRGKLDISQAFKPVGATSVPMAGSSQPMGLNTQGTVYLGSAFGDASLTTTALNTIAYDEYNRLFKVDLADAYRGAPRDNLLPRISKPMIQSSVTTDGPMGLYLTLAAAVPAQEPQTILPRHDLYTAPWMGTEERSEALFEIKAGTMSFSAWQGLGGAQSPFRTRSGDSFASLAHSDHAVRGTLQFNAGTAGQFMLSADSGTGDRSMPLQQAQREASSYTRMGLDWRINQGGLAFSMGALDERMGPLGSYMPMNSALALPSTTRFTALGGDWRLNRYLTLVGEAGLGRTEIDGRFMHLSSSALSSNWRMGLQGQCAIWFCDQLSLELSQPLRIKSGTFEAYLADAPAEYFDPVTFSRRNFSASPSGRQMDLSVRSVHTLIGGSTLQLQATAIRDEQHRRDAKPGYAFIAQWRAGF